MYNGNNFKQFTHMAILSYGQVGWRSAAATPTSGIVTSGLILNLDAGNASSYPGTGTTWTDLSGQNNNGTLVNGVGYSSSNGGALIFDGVNDYVNMESNSAFNLVNISISVWVKLDTTSGINIITARYDNLSRNNGWLMFYNPTTQKIRFDGRESISAYLGTESINTYSVNTWYNITCTKSSNIWSIYVNGTLDKSQTIGLGNITFGTNNMQIGSHIPVDSPSSFGKNSIGGTLAYNRALSASEVLQNFNATKTRFGL